MGAEDLYRSSVNLFGRRISRRGRERGMFSWSPPLNNKASKFSFVERGSKESPVSQSVGVPPQISLVYRYKPISALPSWTFGCGTAQGRPAPSPGRGPYKMMPTSLLSPVYGEGSGTTPRCLVDTGPTSP